MTEPMAPPPPPIPVAPPPSSSNAMKWVLGCGLGCLVVIVIVAIAMFAGGYYLVTNVVPKGVQTAYSQMKTEGKVPEEYKAKYDRLVELGTGPNSSVSAAAMVGGIVMRTLADGQVSEEELGAVNDALAILEANPKMTTQQLQEFYQKHPEYMQGGMPVMPPQAPAPEPPQQPTEVTPPAETPAAPPAAEAPAAPPAGQPAQ